jgi:nucleoside-diphosphate-sugar epimerase
MKVFIAGATGVLGRSTIAAATAAGHQVTGAARTDEKGELVRSLGGVPVVLDLFDAGALAQAVAGHDAVIHMATHIPPMTKAALPGAWAENDRLRRELTPQLVDIARDAGATLFIKESIVFPYRDNGDEWITEDSPTKSSPAVGTALEAEAATAKFADGAAGRRAVVLRFGAFYGPEAASTIDTVRYARRRFAAMVGRADAYFSSIHTDDAARAVVAALEVPSGTYNVVDDEPMTRADYFAALADAFDLRRPRIAPAALTKLGGRKASVMGRSQRVSNRRFREASGWAPAYASARDGWRAIERAWAQSSSDRAGA